MNVPKGMSKPMKMFGKKKPMEKAMTIEEEMGLNPIQKKKNDFMEEEVESLPLN